MSRLERFGTRCNFPYLQGVYLAVNAVEDAYLLVDGPNCSFFKAEHVFGAHDLGSTLLDVGGRHRIVNPDLHPDRMVAEHDEIFVRTFRKLAASPLPAAILIGALPMASITGIDFQRLVDGAGDGGKPVVVLPARSLDRGWIDGYSDTLREIARAIALPEVAPDPARVAIVGHFMDRCEGDQRANVAELRRLVEGLGLEVASVWLDGGSWRGLAAAAGAGWILSLPHGREAARVLAARTGARVVEAPAPLGLEATDDLVRALGEATGRTAEAAALAERAHAGVARAWEWLVPRRFLFRRLGFFGDPWMMPGFCRLAAGLGAEVRTLVALSKPRPGFAPGGAEAAWLPVTPLWEPRLPEPSLEGSPLVADLDLLVCNSWVGMRVQGAVPVVEFGFPSRGYHCCADAPFLGYRGALHFVDRLSNALGERAVFQ